MSVHPLLQLSQLITRTATSPSNGNLIRRPFCISILYSLALLVDFIHVVFPDVVPDFDFGMFCSW